MTIDLSLDLLIAAARADYREIGAEAADEAYRREHHADPAFATSPVMLSVGSRRAHPGTSGFVSESTRAAVAATG